MKSFVAEKTCFLTLTKDYSYKLVRKVGWHSRSSAVLYRTAAVHPSTRKFPSDYSAHS